MVGKLIFWDSGMCELTGIISKEILKKDISREKLCVESLGNPTTNTKLKALFQVISLINE